MIEPGGTLGILGGGQLGRMIALAARPLGLRVVVMDPSPTCAAAGVVDEVFVGDFDDAETATRLAERADVVTIEIEKIGVAVLDAVQTRVPLRPGREALAIIRDRGRQKAWLASAGVPLGPWSPAASADELQRALAGLAGPAFVKSCTGGYDGRGQVEVAGAGEAEAAFSALGASPVVAERALDLEAELSVMVARRPSGEIKTYPVARNHHEHRILVWSALPGDFDPTIESRAAEIGETIADAMNLEGVLAIELFLTSAGELLVNELAPRVHNSYHASERSSLTSQFEQAARAACDMPLGRTECYGYGAIMNVLGDVWLREGKPACWTEALAIEGVRLHLYGKEPPAPGRKMGHLSAWGETQEQAVERAQRAFARL